MSAAIDEKLKQFLEAFIEKVPVEYAALIHIPTGKFVSYSITAAIPHSYFKDNIAKFIELIELSEEIVVPEAIGELQGTVLRATSGYEVIAKLSPNVLLVCGGTDVGSLGITLLKIVELKELIRKRGG